MFFSNNKMVTCQLHKRVDYMNRHLKAYKSLFFIFIMFFMAAFGAAQAAPNQPAANEQPIPYPQVNYKSGFPIDQIKKGEYLAKAGDCIACHTNVTPNGFGPIFAGGLPFKTPFGTFFSQNITPDKETGIGSWTEAQFIRTMHYGVGVHGQNYFPVFPYGSFNAVTTDDLRAIRAYLMSIPAIKQPNKEPDASWPFNWRFGQWGWKLLFFHDEGEFKPDPKQSADWNRGAYLVKGLGHCGECHTPRNFLGGLKRANALTGAMVENFYAPNITSTTLSKLKNEEVVNVFTHDQLLHNRGKVGGPMADVNRNSLKYLTPADLNAMVVYLKTVKSEENVAAAGGAVSDKDAKSLYKKHCAVCHDVGAAGAPKLGDGAEWAARIKLGMETLNQNAIVGINSMPPMGACPTCSQDQIRAVVKYMVAQAQAAGTSAAAAPAVPKGLTIQDGKRIYEAHCASCHAPNVVQVGFFDAPKLGDKSRWKPILDKNFDVLVMHSVKGYRQMPPKGGCSSCNEADIKAAVKYMAQESNTGKDYSLW